MRKNELRKMYLDIAMLLNERQAKGKKENKRIYFIVKLDEQKELILLTSKKGKFFIQYNHFYNCYQLWQRKVNKSNQEYIIPIKTFTHNQVKENVKSVILWKKDTS